MAILSSSLGSVPGFKDIHVVETKSAIHEDPIEALALLFEANFDVQKAVALAKQKKNQAQRIKIKGKIRQLSKRIKILNNLGSVEAWKEKQDCIKERKILTKSL
tara:strand:- start:514 stop:825 length:312 start_codon:yes stop_codon:yes gene_type:complete